MSTYLSLHNDQPFTPRYTPDDVRAGILSSETACKRGVGDLRPGGLGFSIVLLHAMDDEIREQVHGELAPCPPREFLVRYLELATEPLVIG